MGIEFREDAYKDKQLNKYLDSLDLNQEEYERLEQERARKAEALLQEFNDMLDDLNKEYRDLDKLTIKEVANEYA